MSYFRILTSSILFYDLENSKSKEKPLKEYVCPTFRLVLYTYFLKYPVLCADSLLGPSGMYSKCMPIFCEKLPAKSKSI
jgi:hypothetical protein